MNDKQFMVEFIKYIEKDEEYMINVIYDELSEFCMEKDFNEKEITEEQLENIAKTIIENGFDIQNFK